MTKDIIVEFIFPIYEPMNNLILNTPFPNIGDTMKKSIRNYLGNLINKLGIRKKTGKIYEFKQAHSFRKFFRTMLETSGVKSIFTEMFMGYSTGVTESYMKPAIDDIVKEYKKAVPNLTIFEKANLIEQKDIKEEFRKQLLLVAGFRQDEVDKMILSSMNNEDFQKMVRNKLLGAMANNGARQKIIGLGDIESHIAQGWEFVSQLPNDRVIMKIPF